jgi:hypothetical protein
MADELLMGKVDPVLTAKFEANRREFDRAAKNPLTNTSPIPMYVAKDGRSFMRFGKEERVNVEVVHLVESVTSVDR